MEGPGSREGCFVLAHIVVISVISSDSDNYSRYNTMITAPHLITFRIDLETLNVAKILNWLLAGTPPAPPTNPRSFDLHSIVSEAAVYSGSLLSVFLLLYDVVFVSCFSVGCWFCLLAPGSWLLALGSWMSAVADTISFAAAAVMLPSNAP